MKNRKNLAIVALLLGVSVLFIWFLLVPQGSYIYVIVDVEDNTVSIEDLALKKGYLLSMLNPDESFSQGYKSIVLSVFFNQTELFPSTREVRYDIGEGTCALQSNYLPDDLPINAELLISVDLCDANGVVIATAQDSLVYK